MTRTAWNPQKYVAQANIVKNFKRLYNELHNCRVIASPLILTDEDIWDSYDSFHDAEAEDDVFPMIRNRYDAMVLEDMRYKQEEVIQKQLNEIDNLPVDESLGESIVTEEDVNVLSRCKHGLHPLSCSECNPV